MYAFSLSSVVKYISNDPPAVTESCGRAPEVIMKRKVTILIIIAALVLCLMPAPVLADDDDT